jgi:class 3 adenylate cyclase/pimeloyl-ACP methyl ester carboxylesterase
MPMPVEYARQGDRYVAFGSRGEGPLNVVAVSNWLSDVESQWDVAGIGSQWLAVASYARFVWFDQLGTGHSDPIFGEMPSVEVFSDTIGVVMDAAAVDRATLLAADLGTAAAIMFAASNPDRVSGLVLFGGTARWLADDGYRGLDPDTLEESIERIAQMWGTPEYGEFLAPSMRGDISACESVARWGRHAASPGMVRRVFGMAFRVDVRPLLPLVGCPTLVIGSRRAGACAPVSQLEYLAAHVADGRLALYDSADYVPYQPEHLQWWNDTVEEFVTGRPPRHEPDDRVLATVLFTDLVASTETATRLGDSRWLSELTELETVLGAEVEHYRGSLVKTTGDGMLATFDGPARAIRCAIAMRDVVRRRGLELRAGLHTGELAIRGTDVGGIAVHIAARALGVATAGDIVVTSTVRDLVVGSGITFQDDGEHQLKGIPEAWHMFTVATGQH